MNRQTPNQFLKPFLREETDDFVKKCNTKTKTLRMLNALQWLTEISDGLGEVKKGRPALQLVFLITITETITGLRLGSKGKKFSSFDMIKDFFRFISNEDKAEIQFKFQRALLNPRHHTLRFSSILKILYNVRNDVVHRGLFFLFSFLDEKSEQEGYTEYATGRLGTRKRPIRVSLTLGLTYKRFREIAIKTAIANIKSSF